MSLLPVAIIADDLTGAADAAAAFVRPGRPVPVSLSEQARLCEGRSAFAVTTESRGSPPKEASEVVAAAVRSASGAGTGLLYKKVDSNLRGNIGAELAAISDAAGRPIVLAPAYPTRGRTTVHGVALVDGVPAAETEMGRDPQAPVESSHIDDLLRSQWPRVPISSCALHAVREGGRGLKDRLSRDGVVVADAETDSDLEAVAEAALTLDPAPILAGSGGLARAVAAHLLGPPSARATAAAAGGARPVLAVLASSSHRLAEQAEAAAAEEDLSPIPLPCHGLSWEEETVPELGEAIAQAGSALRAGRDAIVHAVGPLPDAPRPVDLVVEHLAHLAFVVLKQNAPGALLVGGGATAHAVLDTLGCHVVLVAEEPLPGMAAGSIVEGHADGLPVALKPGAAGRRDALPQLIRHMRGRAVGREQPR